MKDGLNEFGFEYDQRYFLISGVKQGEQVLTCKKNVERSFQLPKSITICAPRRSINLENWKRSVVGLVENADVGLRFRERYIYTEKTGFFCKSVHRDNC